MPEEINRGTDPNRRIDHFECRHCGTELEYLAYSIDCTEYGNCSVYRESPSDNYLDTIDFDSEETNNYGEYKYSCPECGCELKISGINHNGNEDIWIVYEDDNEDDNTDEDNAELILESPNLKPIVASSFLARCDTPEGKVVTCPRCHHSNLLQRIDANEEEILFKFVSPTADKQIALGQIICVHCHRSMQVTREMIKLF